LPDGSVRTVALNTPENTVFDIASLTKVCPTSTLALSYILEGKLDIDTKVVDFIPELQTNYREDIRIFHLLTHSLDYRVPMKTLRELPPRDPECAVHVPVRKGARRRFQLREPGKRAPGNHTAAAGGCGPATAGPRAVFEPLGMTRSGWDPLSRDWNPVPKNEIAPTEFCNFRGREIQGEIHDESAWVLRKLFPVGSAGMFSCVPDLLKFVKMVLNDEPKGILEMVSQNAFAREDAAKFMPAGATAAEGACTALGWELAQGKFMGSHISPRTFGKTGFTGASIVCDPIAGAAVVLLSDFTYPHREPNADRIHAFRACLADAFFGNLQP
jgi:Beta-lactamase class C and other penicillin binding proteins